MKNILIWNGNAIEKTEKEWILNFYMQEGIHKINIEKEYYKNIGAICEKLMENYYKDDQMLNTFPEKDKLLKFIADNSSYTYEAKECIEPNFNPLFTNINITVWVHSNCIILKLNSLIYSFKILEYYDYEYIFGYIFSLMDFKNMETEKQDLLNTVLEDIYKICYKLLEGAQIIDSNRWGYQRLINKEISYKEIKLLKMDEDWFNVLSNDPKYKEIILKNIDNLNKNKSNYDRSLEITRNLLEKNLDVLDLFGKDKLKLNKQYNAKTVEKYAENLLKINKDKLNNNKKLYNRIITILNFIKGPEICMCVHSDKFGWEDSIIKRYTTKEEFIEKINKNINGINSKSKVDMCIIITDAGEKEINNCHVIDICESLEVSGENIDNVHSNSKTNLKW